MKTKTLFVFTLFVIALFALSACSVEDLPMPPGSETPVVEATQSVPEATQSAPNPTAVPPVDDGEVVEPRSGGVCRVINDYQLLDLIEISVEHGGYLHVEHWVEGAPEYESVFPSGRYAVTYAFPGGHVWEYSPECTIDQVMSEVEGHIGRRLDLRANNAGYMHYSVLLDTNYLETIRMTGNAEEIPGAMVTTGSMSDGGSVVVAADADQVAFAVCEAERSDDSDAMTAVTAGSDETLVVEAWGGDLGDAQVIIPAGETIQSSWQGGAIWSYSCTDTDQVVTIESAKDKPVLVADNGELLDPTQ